MGQAKNRKVAIDELKAKANGKKALVVCPFVDDDLYKGKTVAEYLQSIGNPDAMIVGDMIIDFVPVKALLMVTNTMSDQSAKGGVEAWWKMDANKGPKFAVWLPLNDIVEMTVSGLDHKQELQGWAVGEIMKQTGFADQFKVSMGKARASNSSFNEAMSKFNY